MKHNQMRQVVFPILAAFIWGTAFVAQDMCADAMGAFAFNASRYFIAVLALLVVIVISDKLKKDKPVLSPAEKKAANRQLWLGGLCCGAALAMASNFQQAGMVAGTDSGKAGFLTALYVVLVPVCGLFFKRKVSLPVWIAVALSVIALYLLCINGEFSLAPGDLLILACAVCFTIHILVIDHFTATVDGVKLSCLQFLFAALISTVCMFLFEDVDFAAIWGCILPLLYVGIFSCGVGYTLQILAQKGSNPTVVTILLSLESVFAVIAGAIILKQQMFRPGIHRLRGDVRRRDPGADPVPREEKSGITQAAQKRSTRRVLLFLLISSEQRHLTGVRHSREGAQRLQLLDVCLTELVAGGGKLLH